MAANSSLASAGASGDGGRRVVLFDLDGTITSVDSLTWFLVHTIRKSLWRSLLAIALAPVAGPLLATRRGQTLGASLFLWAASVKRSRRALISEMRVFAGSYFSRKRRVHAAALQALERHLLEGDRVIVVTGATHWLARPLVEALGVRLPVVGSSIGDCCGGLGTSFHCVGEKKVSRLKTRLGIESWDAVYTDSLRDLPLMQRARRAVLVHPSPRLVQRTRAALEQSRRRENAAQATVIEVLDA